MKIEPANLPESMIDEYMEECEDLGVEMYLQDFLERRYSYKERMEICEWGE